MMNTNDNGRENMPQEDRIEDGNEDIRIEAIVEDVHKESDEAESMNAPKMGSEVEGTNEPTLVDEPQTIAESSNIDQPKAASDIADPSDVIDQPQEIKDSKKTKEPKAPPARIILALLAALLFGLSIWLVVDGTFGVREIGAPPSLLGAVQSLFAPAPQPTDMLLIEEPHISKPQWRDDRSLTIWAWAENKCNKALQGNLRAVVHGEDGTVSEKEIPLPESGLQPGQRIMVMTAFEPGEYSEAFSEITMEHGELAFAPAAKGSAPSLAYEYQADPYLYDAHLRILRGTAKNTGDQWVSGSFMLTVATADGSIDCALKVPLPKKGLAPGETYYFEYYVPYAQAYTFAVEDAGIGTISQQEDSDVLSDLRLTSTSVNRGYSAVLFGTLINEGERWLSGGLELILPTTDSWTMSYITLPDKGLPPGDAFVFSVYGDSVDAFDGLEPSDIQWQDFSLSAATAAPESRPINDLSGTLQGGGSKVLTIKNQGDKWLSGDLTAIVLAGDIPIAQSWIILPTRGLAPGEVYHTNIYLNDETKERVTGCYLQDASVAEADASKEKNAKNPAEDLQLTDYAVTTYSSGSLVLDGVVANMGSDRIDGDYRILLLDADKNVLDADYSNTLPEGGLAPGAAFAFSWYVADNPVLAEMSDIAAAVKQVQLRVELQNETLHYREPPAKGSLFDSLRFPTQKAFVDARSQYYVMSMVNDSQVWIDGTLYAAIYDGTKLLGLATAYLPSDGLAPGAEHFVRLSVFGDAFDAFPSAAQLENLTLRVLPGRLQSYASASSATPAFASLSFSPLNLIKRARTDYSQAYWEVLGTVTNTGDREISGSVMILGRHGAILSGADELNLYDLRPDETHPFSLRLPATNAQTMIEAEFQDVSLWISADAFGPRAAAALVCSEVSVREGERNRVTLTGTIKNTGDESLSIGYSLVAFDGDLVVGIENGWETISGGGEVEYLESIEDVPAYTDVLMYITSAY